jgi:hypothetical protein
MNKRQVISSLNKIAEELDNNGLYVEASTITNVMKKVAQVPGQVPQASQDLTKKIQVSIGIQDNLYKIFNKLFSKYKIDFSSSLLGTSLMGMRVDLNIAQSNLMMQPGKYDINIIPSNYTPTSLPELRDYVSRFYKTDVQNYSGHDSMKKYLSSLGKFTKTAVDTLNKIALNKPNPVELSPENLTSEEPTEE